MLGPVVSNIRGFRKDWKISNIVTARVESTSHSAFMITTGIRKLPSLSNLYLSSMSCHCIRIHLDQILHRMSSQLRPFPHTSHTHNSSFCAICPLKSRFRQLPQQRSKGQGMGSALSSSHKPIETLLGPPSSPLLLLTTVTLCGCLG